MEGFVKIDLDKDTSIYIEPNSSNIGEVENGNGRNVFKKTKKEFDKSLNSIVKYSDYLIKKIKETNVELDEVEVEFSVNLDFEIGFAIARSKADAGMNIKIKWKKEKGD